MTVEIQKTPTASLSLLCLCATTASVLLMAPEVGAQVYVEGGIYAAPQTTYVQQPVYQQPVYQQPVYAQQQPGYQTVYVAHSGFFVRAAIGAGFGAFSYTPSGSTARSATYSGVGVVANVAAGLSIADNFALHVDASVIALLTPAYTVGGTTYVGGSDSYNVSNTIVGGGFTYYVMPFNFYVSASLGLAYLNSSNYYGSTTGYSAIGFGLNALVGKEWLLGTKWNFGVAAQLMYSAVPDSNSTTSGLWNNVGVGLVASFTRY